MNWRALSATVRLLPRVSLPLGLALAVLAVLQPALALGFMLAVGDFVGQVPDLVARGAAGWTPNLTIVAAVYVAQQLVGSIQGILHWRLGQRLNHYLDDRVMVTMLAPPGTAHLEDSGTRDRAAEVADGLGASRWRPAEAPGAVASAVSGMLGILVSVGVVVWLNWWLGLLLAAATVAALRAGVQQFVRLIMELIDAGGQAEFRRMEYERDTAVAPGSAKEVRLFGYAPWVLDRWQARLLRVLDLNLRKLAFVSRSLVITLGALVFVVGGGFAWAAIQAARGDLGLAAATVLAQALLAPLRQFESLSQACLDISKAGRPVCALRDLENDLGSDSAPATTTRPVPPTPAPALKSAIRLEQLAFHYPGTKDNVLDGIDLEIPAGSSLAVVGMNGAGKTTLVKLLCRFYDPTGGRITIDGTDLRKHDHTAWQRRVAAIFQDFAHFPMSARDNIGVGDLDAPAERIEAAAKRTGSASFIAELSHGWDTVLTREFEYGTDLSGGQWQRIALSRAVLAADAGVDLLVLDEPAANLDVRAEADLNGRFLELTRGITTIVISHRFSTVRRAERICVLDSGRITELGTHDELAAAGGPYAQLFRLQAERFTTT